MNINEQKAAGELEKMKEVSMDFMIALVLMIDFDRNLLKDVIIMRTK